MQTAFSRRAALAFPLALAASLSVGGCAMVPTGDQASASATAYGPRSFAPLIKRVLPTVVDIAVEEKLSADALSRLPPDRRRPNGGRPPASGQRLVGVGSGFIIDPKGLIVTNNHVIEGAERIVVGLSDGQDYPAKVVGSDAVSDIALIQITAPKPLPTVTFGSSHALAVGDWVIAAGNPFGLGGSVTAGIVSAFGRDLGAGPFDDFIQIDAPINPGNSGGPLFDAEGRVVGMNAEIYTPSGGSVGIGFAIPSERVRSIVADLEAHGTVSRGWLGVTLAEAIGDPFGTRPAPGKGVSVVAVEPGGPADRAGLHAGDIIVAAGGKTLASARALQRVVAATPPGTHLALRCIRHGHGFNVSVEVGLRPKVESD